jgi:hypothetical protein
MPQHQSHHNNKSKVSWHKRFIRGYVPVPPLFGDKSAHQHPVHEHQVHPEQDLRTLVAAKHEESLLHYPEVHLSPDEYVIDMVRRHPIGLLSIWSLFALLTVAIISLLPFYASNKQAFEDALLMSLPSPAAMMVPALIIIAIFALGSFIATYVYEGNRFYLTNESVIQHVRTSLFQSREQVINLVNVEDASYDQRGILQHILGYGTLRLSTQGEETTYRFYFVSNPRRVVNAVNDAVEVAMQNLEGNLRMHQIRE